MSNPSHLGCPNDIGGRHFTDYRPAKSLYEDIKDSNEYRLHLQRNGSKIIQSLEDAAIKQNKCCACENHQYGVQKLEHVCGGKPKFKKSEGSKRKRAVSKRV